MLCRWLDACLAGSRSSHPCGIMQTPCACLGGDTRRPCLRLPGPRGRLPEDGRGWGPENCLTSLTQDRGEDGAPGQVAKQGVHDAAQGAGPGGTAGHLEVRVA